MSYLLDTHVLLWARLEPAKLSKLHQKILQDNDSQKFISAISIWEISLKYSLGKLKLDRHTPEEFLETALKLGFQVATPAPEDFASFYKLGRVPGHNDPFDRMLIWQAIREDLILLSHDNDFANYRVRGLRLN